MDERGSGIPRMNRLLEQAGHPKPVFRIDHDCLVVELQPPERDEVKNHDKYEKVSSTSINTELTHREAILTEARVSGVISTKICVQRLGIASTTAKRIFSDLMEEGLIQKEGAGRSTRYRPV